jgi:hypothetical protein
VKAGGTDPKVRRALSELRAAYREGYQDGRNATDHGVSRWAEGPLADEYARGVREGIRSRKGAA